MRLVSSFLLSLLVVSSLAVEVRAQQSLLPDPVAFEKAHFMKACDGKASFGEGFGTPRDINNDGLMDMVVDEGQLTCRGEKGPDCTDDGCPYNFYLQVAEGGYFMIATVRMFGYDFIQRFGNMVLAMKMNPKYCDRTGGDPCIVTVRVRGTQFTTISKK